MAQVTHALPRRGFYIPQVSINCMACPKVSNMNKYLTSRQYLCVRQNGFKYTNKWIVIPIRIELNLYSWRRKQIVRVFATKRYTRRDILEGNLLGLLPTLSKSKSITAHHLKWVFYFSFFPQQTKWSLNINKSWERESVCVCERERERVKH